MEGGHAVLAFKTLLFTLNHFFEPNFLSSCSHDVIVSRVDYSIGVFCSGNHDCIIAGPIEGC